MTEMRRGRSVIWGHSIEFNSIPSPVSASDGLIWQKNRYEFSLFPTYSYVHHSSRSTGHPVRQLVNYCYLEHHTDSPRESLQQHRTNCRRSLFNWINDQRHPYSQGAGTVDVCPFPSRRPAYQTALYTHSRHLQYDENRQGMKLRSILLVSLARSLGVTEQRVTGRTHPEEWISVCD